MNISIIDCGATANTDTLQTMFIQNAIDKCFFGGRWRSNRARGNI